MCISVRVLLVACGLSTQRLCNLWELAAACVEFGDGLVTGGLLSRCSKRCSWCCLYTGKAPLSIESGRSVGDDASLAEMEHKLNEQNEQTSRVHKSMHTCTVTHRLCFGWEVITCDEQSDCLSLLSLLVSDICWFVEAHCQGDNQQLSKQSSGTKHRMWSYLSRAH